MGGCVRRLEVDLSEIAFAMQANFTETQTLFDTLSGELVVLPEELMDGERLFDEAFAQSLPAWELDLLPIARAVAEDDPRYVPLPEIGSDEMYRKMVEFIDSLPASRLKERLLDAVRGRGAFRRFKEVLAHHPDEEARWFRTRDAYVEHEAREWLETLGIEAVDVGPPAPPAR